MKGVELDNYGLNKMTTKRDKIDKTAEWITLFDNSILNNLTNRVLENLFVFKKKKEERKKTICKGKLN